MEPQLPTLLILTWNNSMYKIMKRFFCLCALFSLLSGCGIIDSIYLPPPEDTAQELFEAGNDSMAAKDYVSAAGYYTKLKDNFPFSPYAIEADLSLADCYFLDEDWGEASEAYKDFESLHPRHEAMPYVLFNIGMANINGYPSIDRPTTQIEEAYSYFKRITESYPGTDYAKSAVEKMVECRKLMAEHELYFGDFFYRMEKYGSALVRYRYILENFQDVTEIVEHAKVKAHAALAKERENSSEKKRESREGSYKDYLKWL